MSTLSSGVQVWIERFLAVKQLFAGLHSMLRVKHLHLHGNMGIAFLYDRQ